MLNDGSCANCGGLDWIVDYGNGFNTCPDCGCCAEDLLMVVAPGYKQSHDGEGNRLPFSAPTESVPSSAIVTDVATETAIESNRMRNRSPPYQRITYFGERISQWCMREPAIPDDDLQRIVAELRKRIGNDPALWWRGGPEHQWRLLSEHVITKPECRELLKAIDDTLPRPYFRRKYLEKFFTIRWELCGVPSFGRDASCDLIIFLREGFAALQTPFERAVRQTGKRYSFPNYNFVFRRLFDLFGCSHYGDEFPPLQSARKRQETVAAWLDMLPFVNWV